MKPSDRCTPSEELALELERLSESLWKIRQNFRTAMSTETDVALSDLNGEILDLAGSLGPEVVQPDTLELSIIARTIRAGRSYCEALQETREALAKCRTSVRFARRQAK